MGEPRSRPARRELIIDAPARQSPLQRVMSSMMTLAFWALWIYLWLPLLTLLGWFGWVHQFLDVMVEKHGAATLLGLLGQYAMIAGTLCSILLAWALIEWLRFRRQCRRRHPPLAVSAPELADRLHMSPSAVRRMHLSRRLSVYYSRRGRVSKVRASIVGRPGRRLNALIRDLEALSLAVPKPVAR